MSFAYFDDTDDNFDTADIDDGDNDDKYFVDERGDFNDGGEQNERRDLTTNDPSHGDTFFFFDVFPNDLPTTDFLRGEVFRFDDMIADMMVK